VLILDSGGLNRLSNRNRRSAALIAALRGEGLWPPRVPTVVIAESTSGAARTDANVNRLLKICDVDPIVSEATARRAGQLRAHARRGSAVDALVVALAEPGSISERLRHMQMPWRSSRSDDNAPQHIHRASQFLDAPERVDRRAGVSELCCDLSCERFQCLFVVAFETDEVDCYPYSGLLEEDDEAVGFEVGLIAEVGDGCERRSESAVDVKVLLSEGFGFIVRDERARIDVLSVGVVGSSHHRIPIRPNLLSWSVLGTTVVEGLVTDGCLRLPRSS
jgi:hypothetical protein